MSYGNSPLPRSDCYGCGETHATKAERDACQLDYAERSELEDMRAMAEAERQRKKQPRRNP